MGVLWVVQVNKLLNRLFGSTEHPRHICNILSRVAPNVTERFFNDEPWDAAMLQPVEAQYASRLLQLPVPEPIEHDSVRLLRGQPPGYES